MVTRTSPNECHLHVHKMYEWIHVCLVINTPLFARRVSFRERKTVAKACKRLQRTIFTILIGHYVKICF